VTDYHLPAGYRSRTDPQPFGDPATDVEWQPDVYTRAVELADAVGATVLIDLGCGMARKLLPLSARFITVGVDHPDLIDRLEHHPGLWIGADLDATTPLDIPTHLVAGAVVICSDVIEHLTHPERLCTTLRSLLRDATCCVLSTPDRARTHGHGHLGPPPNPAHVREWTAAELVQFVTDQGLDVVEAAWTRSHTGTTAKATTLLVIGGTSWRSPTATPR